MYFANPHLTNIQAGFAVGLAAAVAAMSWKYVETPFRSRRSMPNTRLGWISGVLAVLLLSAALFTQIADGFPGRLGEKATRLLSASRDADPFRDKCNRFAIAGRKEECQFGPSDQKVSYVIVGDSHAAALRGAVEASGAFSGRAGSLWWMGACPLVLGTQKTPNMRHAECEDFRAKVLIALRQSPEIDTVVLGGRWVPYLTGVATEVGGAYRTYLIDGKSDEKSDPNSQRVFRDGFRQTIDTLTKAGKKVIVLGPLPEAGYSVPHILALAELNGTPPASFSVDQQVPGRALVERIFAAETKDFKDATFVGIWNSICTPECKLVIDDSPVFMDDDHITYKASQLLVGPHIAKSLDLSQSRN